MGLIQLLFTNPAMFVILAVLLLYSVIAHEVSHGLVAYMFGDDTAMRYGRITLNPASHIDPIGTLMLLLVGFGWAKPVPVNYDRLTHHRLGVFCVALAGCFANIMIAFAGVFLLQFDFFATNPVISTILSVLVRINVILGGFNLIPIPPLDGSKILYSILPEEFQGYFSWLEAYGFYILIFLLFTGILNPMITFMQNIIYFFISLIFGAVKGTVNI